MRDEPQAVIDDHQLWGCKHAAIGGLPGEYRTAEGFVKFAKENDIDVAPYLSKGKIADEIYKKLIRAMFVLW